MADKAKWRLSLELLLAVAVLCFSMHPSEAVRHHASQKAISAMDSGSLQTGLRLRGSRPLQSGDDNSSGCEIGSLDQCTVVSSTGYSLHPGQMLLGGNHLEAVISGVSSVQARLQVAAYGGLFLQEVRAPLCLYITCCCPNLACRMLPAKCQTRFQR